ncbi:hypothetical protein DENSPDRAFT_357269 [Dentipellis sp. KUC8613]|nr:hypothetical protein DENSPDRAFT_357269 [Dentipellis sp. KUC8613]
MDAETLAHQLEELQLLKCSLLPGELLTFLEDAKLWSQALEPDADAAEAISALQQHLTQKASTSGASNTHPSNASSPASSAVCFRIGLENTDRVYFEVALPRSYPAHSASVAVRGDTLGRADQLRWQATLAAAREEVAVGGTEYPIFQLISDHLLPLLHAELHAAADSPAPGEVPAISSPTPVRYHALLTSHHLVSPTKRRNMQAWAGALSLAGFAKVGYPGVIYCEGMQDNVEDFVANVKAMQWLALRVRFVEPLGDTCDAQPGRRWVEFERVGDVVEEMRRLGRESYVVEMGIGSAGNTTSK